MTMLNRISTTGWTRYRVTHEWGVKPDWKGVTGDKVPPVTRDLKFHGTGSSYEISLPADTMSNPRPWFKGIQIEEIGPERRSGSDRRRAV